jgi:pilus assembly protein Flp/PilA
LDVASAAPLQISISQTLFRGVAGRRAHIDLLRDEWITRDPRRMRAGCPETQQRGGREFSRSQLRMCVAARLARGERRPRHNALGVPLTCRGQDACVRMAGVTRHAWHISCATSSLSRDHAPAGGRISHTRMRVTTGTREGETTMKTLIIRMRAFVREEEGQDLIEYALLAALVALAATVAMTNLGTGISNVFGSVTAKLTPAS